MSSSDTESEKEEEEAEPEVNKSGNRKRKINDTTKVEKKKRDSERLVPVVNNGKFKPKMTSSPEKSEILDRKIYVKCSNTNDKKRAWDKKHYCVYCQQPYFKLPRHFEDKHKSEEEVVRLIALQYTKEDSKETKNIKEKARKVIIDSLRQKGNYHQNILVLERGYGELVVKRCPTGQTPYTEFLPCQHCLEFFFRKDLHRHMKRCHVKDTQPKYKGFRVQGNASMLLPSQSLCSEELKKIFSRMKVDDVSIGLKLDQTIVKYGNVLCRKHYNNDDQTYYISNKLRELGRLLLHMKSNETVSYFEQIINPELFTEVLKCVQEMCGWNPECKTIDVPSLGIKLGQLLTKIAFMLKGEAIINGDKNKRALAEDFISLVEMKWNDEIARVSRTELENRHWNKPQMLPLTEDLLTVKNHLVSVRKTSIDELSTDNQNVKAWRNLCSSTLASLILLNRRREGETSKFELKHMQEMKNGNVINEDVQKSLSKFELQLCKYFKRIEIRGKRGRKVPLLITKELESAIQLIVSLRGPIGVNPNNKFVFAIPTANSLNYIRGNDAIRKHVQLCSLKCPQAVSSTKLRKHIATLSQILNLQESELEMLAGFLGHDISVHRDFYRLPENTLQIAKCGKLLMLMDKGNITDFAGKSLNEIDLDMGGELFGIISTSYFESIASI